MPFTNSNALGKLRIVTACGIGGAPLLRTSAIRGVPPLTALTQISVHHRLRTRICQHLNCGKIITISASERVMAILKSVIEEDPFVSVAWNANVALLALAKISKRIKPSPDEHEGLSETLKFVESIGTVGE